MPSNAEVTGSSVYVVGSIGDELSLTSVALSQSIGARAVMGAVPTKSAESAVIPG